MTLVSGDLTLSPLGSDKEEYDDEAEIGREGQEAVDEDYSPILKPHTILF